MGRTIRLERRTFGDTINGKDSRNFLTVLVSETVLLEKQKKS